MATIVLDQPFNLTSPTNRLFRGLDEYTGYVDYAGADNLLGGAGADRFVFLRGDGQDRIGDFQNGLDRIEIASGAERFADLRIVDGGANVVVSYGADRIALANIDHKLIDAGDFLFT